MENTYTYDTSCCIQECAINNFNYIRKDIEEMHNAKIEFIEMYRPFCKVNYIVKYKLIKESEQE